MTPENLTLISGVVLLLVFALVGWRVRRRRTVHERERTRTDEKESP